MEMAFALLTAKQTTAALMNGAVNISTLLVGTRGCLNTQTTLALTEEVRDSASDRRVLGERRLENTSARPRQAGSYLPMSTALCLRTSSHP